MPKVSQYRFNAIKEKVLTNWENTSYAERWTDMPTFTFFEKINNEKYLKNVTDELIHFLKKVDLKTPTENLSPLFNNFFSSVISQCPFLSQDEIDYLRSDEQLEATKAFLNQAFEEDSNLSLEGLGQAVRNFWIITLLQTALGKKVSFTQPYYGYSMLYPYTDNIMDSEGDSKSSKSQFCKKLTLHLLNMEDPETHSDRDDPYERVWAQVKKIYAVYPPSEFRNVQNSLLAIHEAQIESLKQQQSTMLPYEVDLLGKSFYKGGTSVLADAFLVEPNLSFEGQVFAYTYGAILQLCDDLQDMSVDKAARHYTLFSQLKDHYVLDQMLNKLNGFIDHALGLLKDLHLKSDYNIQLIVAKNTRLLLAYAVMEHEFAFSKTYVAKVNQYLPVRPKAFKRSMKRIKKALRENEEVLKGLGYTSLDDMKLSDIKLMELTEKDLTNVS